MRQLGLHVSAKLVLPLDFQKTVRPQLGNLDSFGLNGRHESWKEAASGFTGQRLKGQNLYVFL